MNASSETLSKQSIAQLDAGQRDLDRVRELLEHVQALLRVEAAELAQQLAHLGLDALTHPRSEFEREVLEARDARGRRVLAEIEVALQRCAHERLCGRS
jgi:hypothetical protein